MLLVILIIGLRLGGVSLGLLSGLGLGLLTFWVQPTAPPNDLMLLQATWFLLMATLEAIGFFYILEIKLKTFIEQINSNYTLLCALLCYGLVFLTGDTKWLYRLVQDPNGLDKSKAKLLVPAAIGAHMALLASPLSISGILLIVVVGNSSFSVLDLIGTTSTITIAITATSSLLTYLMPNRWLIKAYGWLKNYGKDDRQIVPPSTDKLPLIFLLLVPAEVLFLLIKPEINSLTRLSCMEKIFPVRFPIFFALAMLSIAAVAMLWSKIKPAKILQTHRFRLGIQQFFIFLGLTWLLDSLISHDKVHIIDMLSGGTTGYGCYLMAALYMLLIDIPIIIWLFSRLLIEQNCPIVMLSIWLIVVHSLVPLSSWMSHVVQTGKKSKDI